MNYTGNYNLKKPEATDTVNIQEFNDNADIIDATLAAKLDSNANAVSASKLAAARKISVSGDVTGSVSFDGSSNANIVASVADDSHNHVISNVDGLQTVLDGVDAKLKTHDNKIVETSNLVSNEVSAREAADIALTAIATTSANGLMSATDKTKLDGVANNANKYVHPTTAGNKHIPSGGATNQTLLYGGSSGTAAWTTLIDSMINLTSSLQTKYGVTSLFDALNKIITPNLLQTYGTAGTYTYTVPAGVTRILAVVVGGGGGGGGGAKGNTTGGGGGGGGGGYVTCGSFNVTQGQAIPIVVGAGGASGVGGTSGDGSAGGTGGTSSANGILASGGGGGRGGNYISTGGAGGTGSAMGGIGGYTGSIYTGAPGGAPASGILMNNGFANAGSVNLATGALWCAGGGGGGIGGSSGYAGGSGGNGIIGTGGTGGTGGYTPTVGATGGNGCGGGGGGGSYQTVSGAAGGAGGTGYLALYSIALPIGL